MPMDALPAVGSLLLILPRTELIAGQLIIPAPARFRVMAAEPAPLSGHAFLHGWQVTDDGIGPYRWICADLSTTSVLEEG